MLENNNDSKTWNIGLFKIVFILKRISEEVSVISVLPACVRDDNLML